MRRSACYYILLMLLILLFSENLTGAWIKKSEQVSEQPKKEEKIIEKKEVSFQIPPPVELIKWSVSGISNIKINWNPPKGTNILALIYRGTEVLNSKDKIANAKFLTNIPAEFAEFIDKIPQSGEYYYAILTTKNNLTNFTFVEDDNYNSIGIKISLPSLPPAVNKIETLISEDKNSIILKWDPVTNVKNYIIYRNEEPISNKTILDKSELVGFIEKNITSFTDRTAMAGIKYYYSILTENEIGRNEELLNNYTKTGIEIPKIKKEAKEEVKPVEEKEVIEKQVKKKVTIVKPTKKILLKKKVSYSEKIEYVIKNFYYNRNYRKSAEELEKIVRKEGISWDEQKKAYLFLGKSYYWLGEYNKALKFFTKISDEYPDEVSFWISRISNKLK